MYVETRISNEPGLANLVPRSIEIVHLHVYY